MVNFAQFKALWQPFWIFWRPFWIFIGSSGIKFSNLSTSFLTICQNHAINKNYSLKFEIRGAPTSKYCCLRVFMAFRQPSWISGNAQGESFTPSWILFCTIRRIIIRWEKKVYQTFPSHAMLLLDYMWQVKIILHLEMYNTIMDLTRNCIGPLCLILNDIVLSINSTPK